jgi:hypothetical protein
VVYTLLAFPSGKYLINNALTEVLLQVIHPFTGRVKRWFLDNTTAGRDQRSNRVRNTVRKVYHDGEGEAKVMQHAGEKKSSYLSNRFLKSK